jgi:hypothetical protein
LAASSEAGESEASRLRNGDGSNDRPRLDRPDVVHDFSDLDAALARRIDVTAPSNFGWDDADTKWADYFASRPHLADNNGPGNGPLSWAAISGAGKKVWDFSGEVAKDTGSWILRTAAMDSPEEARLRADRIATQQFKNRQAADYGKYGWVDTGLACKFVGTVSMAVANEGIAGYENSFDQTAARSFKEAAELYAGGAAFDLVAKSAFALGGRIVSRFGAGEAKTGFASLDANAIGRSWSSTNTGLYGQNVRLGAFEADFGLSSSYENLSVKIFESGSSSAANTAGRLKYLGNDTWESPLGLQYGPDFQYGNRVQHVLRHSANQPLREFEHGVFDGSRREVIGLIDEAWAIAKQGGPNVQSHTVGVKTVYTVDMGRRVGWVGGQGGAALGHPVANNIQLVIRNGNQVITGFPKR